MLHPNCLSRIYPYTNYLTSYINITFDYLQHFVNLVFFLPMSGKIIIHHVQLNWKLSWFTIMLDLLVENQHSWSFPESKQLLKHIVIALYFIDHVKILVVSNIRNINYIFYQAILIAEVFTEPVNHFSWNLNTLCDNNREH